MIVGPARCGYPKASHWSALAAAESGRFAGLSQDSGQQTLAGRSFTVFLATSVSSSFTVRCDRVAGDRNLRLRSGRRRSSTWLQSDRLDEYPCRLAYRFCNGRAGGRPREPQVAERDVPGVAKAAVIRRLDKDVLPNFRRIVVKLSERMPGYVVWGEVSGPQTAEMGPFERFVVVVPGGFALLDRDGSGLIDKYWNLNGCR
jgi:hypothetical protein